MIISNINRKYCLINVTSSSRCSSRSRDRGEREVGGGKDGGGRVGAGRSYGKQPTAFRSLVG